jgi:hypothetical protein
VSHARHVGRGGDVAAQPLRSATETYAAASAICCSVSVPQAGGTTPPPFVTWTMTSYAGLRSSRFGDRARRAGVEGVTAPAVRREHDRARCGIAPRRIGGRCLRDRSRSASSRWSQWFSLGDVRLCDARARSLATRRSSRHAHREDHAGRDEPPMCLAGKSGGSGDPSR